MEFVVLGLLALRAMSVYELNKALERGVTLFYSASLGSLNAALNKLLGKGWVAEEAKVEHGRRKRVFSLTPAGRQALQAWLGSDIEEEKVKEPALTRLYFMGLLPLPERLPPLRAHVQNLRQRLAALKAIHQEAAARPVPARLSEIYECQRLTLQYGLDYYAFSLRWYENLLKDLERKANG